MKNAATRSIRGRLYFLSGVLIILLAVMAAIGHWASGKIEAHLRTVFADRLIPMEQLGYIREALNDNRTTLIQADSFRTPETMRTAAERIAANAKTATSNWDAYVATYLTPDEKILADRFASERGAWLNTGLRPATDALNRGEATRASQILGEHGGLLAKALATSQELVKLQIDVAKQEYEAAGHTHDRLNWALAGACVLGVLLGLGLAWMITRSITVPIDDLRQTMQTLAVDHDLSVRVTPTGSDECSQMAVAFNSLLESFDSALRAIKQQSLELSSSATELAGAANTITDGTRSQSEAAASTAAAVQQLAVSVAHVADSAANAASLAAHSTEAACLGADEVESASNEMARIAEGVRASSVKAQSLAQRSEDISGIVQVIKDVAEQTNLLALNAAIEAARAGDQGRGFAVVADEVRKLAERTSRSAAEITGLINLVQTDTREVGDTMQHSIAHVEHGVQLAQKTAATLMDIKSGTNETRDKIGEIASATREQSSASNDIARHVEKIAQMTEENSAAASQSAALSERLESLAVGLRDSVGRFKTA